MKYRIRYRNFDIENIEEIVRYSNERYFDTITLKKIVIGKYNNKLILIPYEENENEVIPVTVHLTITDESESGSVEINPHITAELNVKGEIIGIEILHASEYLRDTIFKSVQGKMSQIVSSNKEQR